MYHVSLVLPPFAAVPTIAAPIVPTDGAVPAHSAPIDEITHLRYIDFTGEANGAHEPQAKRPTGGSGRKHFVFCRNLPMTSGPRLIGRSFTLVADLVLDKPTASGAILGSRSGGWSLYLDQGRAAFPWAKSAETGETLSIQAAQALPTGKTKLKLRFAVTGRGGPAEVIIRSNGAELARGNLPSSVLMPTGNTETLDVGRDIAVPVVGYRTPHGIIEGDVPHVSIDLD